MIKQTAIGLNSIEEANPYNKKGFLPIITAPMYSVVNETNYQLFLDNKIQVCLPRGKNGIGTQEQGCFESYSLQEFVLKFIKTELPFSPQQVCIDTANGNMPELHNVIKEAKQIHGDNLIIMAGNVASVETFVELAKTGVDYIRIGIGGGGCNTTSNTGVGQEDLEFLIAECRREIKQYLQIIAKHNSNWVNEKSKPKKSQEEYFGKEYQTWANVSKVKIVADGISSYIKQCETKYGFNDNGYAAINKLLFAGADLVMVGSLFAQCLESAGEKQIQDGEHIVSIEEYNQWYAISTELSDHINNGLVVKHSGTSTSQEQKKSKKPFIFDGLECTEREIQQIIKDDTGEYATVDYLYTHFKNDTKPLANSVNWIPVKWSLSEWLNGSSNPEEYPYLMGWIDSIKSAMSNTGKKTLNSNCI